MQNIKCVIFQRKAIESNRVAGSNL